MLRSEWEATVPATVARVSAAWGLDVGEPLVHDGECSWVAPCTRGAEPLVLKIGWPHPESRDEALGLKEWAGDGTVLLHESDGDVLLLERLGSPLSLLAEEEQDPVIAELLLRLWRDPVGRFRPLAQMCDQWADGARPEVEPGLARAGLELFRSLPRDPTPPKLLATDLHAGNVLAGTREPWLVIDPKPYVGDPAYDVTQHLFNCARVDVDPWPVIRRMAELCELDAERVRQWTFARAVVESKGRADLQVLAQRLAP